MDEMTFRRKQEWIIIYRSIFAAFIIFVTSEVLCGVSMYDLIMDACVGLICGGIGPAIIFMLNHAYDKIHLDAEGITVTRFAFSKKKRTQEFLAWDNILRIKIGGGGRGGADFFVYRQDNTTILFQFSRRRYLFIKEVYPREIENPNQIPFLP